MHNLGLTCNDYQNDGWLTCSNGSTPYESGSLCCSLGDFGNVICGINGYSDCRVYSSGLSVCN